MSLLSRTTNANASNNQPAPPSPFRPRFGFGASESRWEMLPRHKTIIRFDLTGLGDPFYRILGHDLDLDLTDMKAIIRELEQENERTTTLKAHLDRIWQPLAFTGAVLVYRWQANTWKALAQPTIRAKPQEDDSDDDDDEDKEKNASKSQPAMFQIVRALDLGLVINVLARARSQLLLPQSPLLFNAQYLSRTLVTDDPRLVALGRATGYTEE